MRDPCSWDGESADPSSPPFRSCSVVQTFCVLYVLSWMEFRRRSVIMFLLNNMTCTRHTPRRGESNPGVPKEIAIEDRRPIWLSFLHRDVQHDKRIEIPTAFPLDVAMRSRALLEVAHR